jgi:hypothetical protein
MVMDTGFGNGVIATIIFLVVITGSYLIGFNMGADAVRRECLTFGKTTSAVSRVWQCTLVQRQP